MVDPAATYIDTTVTLAADVTLFPGTILQGRTAIGEGVEIGPGCRLVDCTVGEHTTLEHTVARLSRHRRRLRGRSLRGARTGRPHSVRDRAPGRSTLARRGRGARRLIVRPTSAHSGHEGTHGAGHEEAAAPAGGAVEPRRWPRRSPTTSASSSGTRTSSSSPTARSTAASARTCAAPTCSSSRPTAPPTEHVGERRDHGAADHDRRRPPGLGQAHHRRHPELRLRPPGPQGREPRADHRQARRQHVRRRRHQPADVGRPALRPDPGLLRRPGRPPHRHAGARRLHPRQPPRGPGGRVARTPAG